MIKSTFIAQNICKELISMKAVIMAGGEGKRLKPVSGDTPKPLVPFCGRPVMEHIVRLLKKHGITDICATLKYRPDEIKSFFGNGESFGVRMQYRIEAEALGTAGGVKNCEDFYGNEDFLVISGDAICDFDLSELINAHKKHSPAVSIALYPHSDPLRYGLALCDGESCVRSFIEKPDWAHVVTNLVNTGIYIISPRAIELVPKGKCFDFAKDLFPLLLKKNELIYGFPCDGYWCDIGTPKSYYQCCVDALEGRLSIDLCGGFEPQESTENHSEHSNDDSYSTAGVNCRDRARLMSSVSKTFMDMGADFSDGFCIKGDDYELKIEANPDMEALRILASANSVELSEELAFSAASLLEELEKRLEN